MRGASNFNSLFADVLPTVTKQEGKGRSADLNLKRDELILYRYYFYGSSTPYRYDLIINKLSAEFFLSERRIQDIIGANLGILRRVKDSRPTLRQLREMYPHFVWIPVAKPQPKVVSIEL